MKTHQNNRNEEILTKPSHESTCNTAVVAKSEDIDSEAFFDELLGIKKCDSDAATALENKNEKQISQDTNVNFPVKNQVNSDRCQANDKNDFNLMDDLDLSDDSDAEDVNFQENAKRVSVTPSSTNFSSLVNQDRTFHSSTPIKEACSISKPLDTERIPSQNSHHSKDEASADSEKSIHSDILACEIQSVQNSEISENVNVPTKPISECPSNDNSECIAATTVCSFIFKNKTSAKKFVPTKEVNAALANEESDVESGKYKKTGSDLSIIEKSNYCTQSKEELQFNCLINPGFIPFDLRNESITNTVDFSKFSNNFLRKEKPATCFGSMELRPSLENCVPAENVGICTEFPAENVGIRNEFPAENVGICNELPAENVGICTELNVEATEQTIHAVNKSLAFESENNRTLDCNSLEFDKNSGRENVSSLEIMGTSSNISFQKASNKVYTRSKQSKKEVRRKSFQVSSASENPLSDSLLEMKYDLKRTLAVSLRKLSDDFILEHSKGSLLPKIISIESDLLSATQVKCGTKQHDESLIECADKNDQISSEDENLVFKCSSVPQISQENALPGNINCSQNYVEEDKITMERNDAIEAQVNINSCTKKTKKVPRNRHTKKKCEDTRKSPHNHFEEEIEKSSKVDSENSESSLPPTVSNVSLNVSRKPKRTNVSKNETKAIVSKNETKANVSRKPKRTRKNPEEGIPKRILRSSKRFKPDFNSEKELLIKELHCNEELIIKCTGDTNNSIALDDASNTKFDASNTKFDASNTKFDASNTKFDVSNTKFDESNTKFDVSNTKFDASNTKFDASNTKFDASNTKFDASNSKFDASNSKFDESNTKFDESNTKFDASNTKFDASNTKFDTALPSDMLTSADVQCTSKQKSENNVRAANVVEVFNETSKDLLSSGPTPRNSSFVILQELPITIDENQLQKLIETSGDNEAGQSTFEKGQSTFEKGQSTFVKGQSTFEKGESTFEEGESTFEKGESTFEKEQSTFEKEQSTFEDVDVTGMASSYTQDPCKEISSNGTNYDNFSASQSSSSIEANKVNPRNLCRFFKPKRLNGRTNSDRIMDFTIRHPGQTFHKFFKSSFEEHQAKFIAEQEHGIFSKDINQNSPLETAPKKLLGTSFNIEHNEIIPSNIVKSERISSNIEQNEIISSNIDQNEIISSNIDQNEIISSNIVKSERISSNIEQNESISSNMNGNVSFNMNENILSKMNDIASSSIMNDNESSKMLKYNFSSPKASHSEDDCNNLMNESQVCNTGVYKHFPSNLANEGESFTENSINGSSEILSENHASIIPEGNDIITEGNDAHIISDRQNENNSAPYQPPPNINLYSNCSFSKPDESKLGPTLDFVLPPGYAIVRVDQQVVVPVLSVPTVPQKVNQAPSSAFASNCCQNLQQSCAGPTFGCSHVTHFVPNFCSCQGSSVMAPSHVCHCNCNSHHCNFKSHCNYNPHHCNYNSHHCNYNSHHWCPGLQSPACSHVPNHSHQPNEANPCPNDLYSNVQSAAPQPPNFPISPFNNNSLPLGENNPRLCNSTCTSSAHPSPLKRKCPPPLLLSAKKRKLSNNPADKTQFSTIRTYGQPRQ